MTAFDWPTRNSYIWWNVITSVLIRAAVLRLLLNVRENNLNRELAGRFNLHACGFVERDAEFDSSIVLNPVVRGFILSLQLKTGTLHYFRPLKADSHIACRAHDVPLPCRVAKGLECVFPI
jgi:hypothetical protein